MKDNIEVRCCNCEWQGDEDELILVETDESIHNMDNRLDREFIKACPNCLTDDYLSDDL